MGKHTITVPTNRDEIPLMKLLQFEALKDISEEEKVYNAISIFCDMTLTEVSKVPLKTLKLVRDELYNVLNKEEKFVDRFTLDGVKYGFIPNLDDISTGEFIDIDTYSKEPLDLWKVMSILYRPVIKEGQNNRYEILPYNADINDKMRFMPAGVAQGATVFFWDLGIDLLTHTQKYLSKISKKEQQRHMHSMKNGDGLDSYIYWLEETLKKWTQLRHSPFINLYYGRLTNRTWQQWKTDLLTRNE